MIYTTGITLAKGTCREDVLTEKGVKLKIHFPGTRLSTEKEEERSHDYLSLRKRHQQQKVSLLFAKNVPRTRSATEALKLMQSFKFFCIQIRYISKASILRAVKHISYS